MARKRKVMAALNFPATCDTPRKRLEFAYAMNAKLRKLHNAMGRWYKDGLTQTQYDKLPAKIRSVIAYTPNITKAQFRDYQHNKHPIYEKLVLDFINQSKAVMEDSTTWVVDVNDVID